MPEIHRVDISSIDRIHTSVILDGFSLKGVQGLQYDLIKAFNARRRSKNEVEDRQTARERESCAEKAQ